MSDDSKRRQSRVQGSWAATSSGGSRRLADSSEVTVNRPLASQPKFFYKETKQVYRKKPADIFIEKEGDYILSKTSDNKTCSLKFYPDFVFDANERREVLESLRACVPWQERFCLVNGERVRMPRLVSWYGPVPYHFSGATLPPEEKWPPLVASLHDRIRDATGYEFNSVLLNLYRDGRDSVAWHSDDELLFGIHPVIASLSFGDTRVFELREKASDGNYELCQHVRVPLKDGSMLIMEGETQSYWQHRIPKEFHDRKVRINLTFRTVFKKN